MVCGNENDVDGLKVDEVTILFVGWVCVAAEDSDGGYVVAVDGGGFGGTGGMLRSGVSCFFLPFFLDIPRVPVWFAFVCLVGEWVAGVTSG